EVIPVGERDPGLTNALRAEAPGILRWMAQGARILHENSGRIEIPAVVADATRIYKSENDVLGDFLSVECEGGKSRTVTSGELYSRYEQWCEDNGGRPMPKRTLGLRLQDRGFAPTK